MKNKPFDVMKASDYTDDEIFKFWVNNDEITQLINPKSVMPLFLYGSKGCGKTHLLRYCSFSVQMKRFSGCLNCALMREGYLGIYIRTDALNSGRFSLKGQTDEVWQNVFAVYFECCVALEVVSMIKNYPITGCPCNGGKHLNVEGFIDLINDMMMNKITSLNDLESFLRKRIMAMDQIINSCAITQDLQDMSRYMFAVGTLYNKIAETLLVNYQDSKLLYNIDELENLNENQQKVINTLIRYRNPSCSTRVGSRLYGLKTMNTINNGEAIYKGSEYEISNMDDFIRSKSQTEKSAWLRSILQSRLSGGNDEEGKKIDVDRLFVALDATNYYQNINSYLRPVNHNKKYFVRLVKLIKSYYPFVDDQMIDDIRDALSVDDNFLLEKINVFLFYRLWSKPGLLLDKAKSIKKEIEFENGRIVLHKEYREVYSHFSNDMLAQLCKDYGRIYPYGGLSDIVCLSQGIPRNFLGLLRQIYKVKELEGEVDFTSVDLETQAQAVLDCANWFWEDSQPDPYGREVRAAVNRLATLLREVRYSDTPSECSVCAFSLYEPDLTQKIKDMLEVAERWSYLIKIKSGAKDKNSNKIHLKYQINPIIAPKWGLSIYRRGILSINYDLANAIFDETYSKDFDKLMIDRVKGMNIHETNQMNMQMRLF